jgi:hypothetical protein
MTMNNPVEAVIHRIALAVAAGTYTLEYGIEEAVNSIDDLFGGRPHMYDFEKVRRAVVAKVNEMNE